MARSIPVETGPKVDLRVQEVRGRRELRVAALRPLYEVAQKARSYLRRHGTRMRSKDIEDLIYDLGLAIALAEGVQLGSSTENKG